MPYNGNRFRRHRIRMPGKLHPLVIVGICLGAAIIVALIIGNLLHFFLDDETLQRWTSGPAETEPPAQWNDRAAPSIRAYPFTLGDPLKSLTANDALPPSALSVSLNTPDGTLLYTSEVAEFQNVTRTENVSLTKSINDLIPTVPYLCGVFYPQAFGQETPELFYAVSANEAALLREFAHAGGAEVLLVGLPFDNANLGNTLTYLKLIKDALGSTPLGVSVPISVAASWQGPELLPALQEFASYLALDLQADTLTPPEELLKIANYYLVEYQMRLLLASDQTELINLADATVSDFAIVTAPPRPEEPAPPEDGESG